MRRSGYDISISLVVCFLLCADVYAQSEPFKWTYIDVDIEVQENGDLLISERQQYSLKAGPGGQRHELSRPFLTDRIDDMQNVEVYELTGDGQASSEPLITEHRVETDQNDLRLQRMENKRPPRRLLKNRVRPDNAYQNTPIPRAEKNRSGPQMSKLPPGCPNSPICPNDFSLDPAAEPRSVRAAYSSTG
jgi:hypothetical protein